MASIGELVISLRADIASFRSGMNEANSSLDTLKQHSSAAAEASKELARAMETIASVEVIRRLADFGAQLVESAAQLGHMTEALGINAETYQTLQYAARESGVSTDVFARSMETLTRNLELVSQGGAASAAKVMAQLGLSAKNADGSLRSAADVLQDLAKDKIFQAEDAGTKLAQVMILMGGRTGEAALIVNELNSKLANFSETAADAVARGQVLSEETIKGAEQMESKLTTIWTRMKNSFTTMVVTAYQHPFAPGVSPDQVRSLPSWLGGDKTPAPGATGPGQSPAPGPAVVDPTKAKQLTSFSEEYKKLLDQYQQDLDYQSRLRDAYQQGADAVRKLEVAHAGEEAAEKAIAAAQHDHVAISTQEIAAVYALAAADKQASQAASEQKELTAGLAKQEEEHRAKMQAVLEATDGLAQKNNELADTLGLLEEAYQRGIIPTLEEYRQRVQAAEQAAAGLGADKGMKEFASGLSSSLSSAVGKLTDFQAIITEASRKGGQSFFQQMSKDAADFVAELEKLLLKLLIINPLLNALGLGNEGGGKQLPTLGGGLFGWLFGGGASAPAAARPGRSRLRQWRRICGRRNGRHGQPARSLQGDAGRKGRGRRECRSRR